MEHQSSTRPEPFPSDVQDFLTLPEEDKLEEQSYPDLHLASFAIDHVRSSGWWNYDCEGV